jgi:hypothetical protein
MTETLATLSIVVVSFGGEQEGAIDGFISERGLTRRSEMYDRIRKCVLGVRPGPTRRGLVAAFSRTSGAARRFKSRGDRTAPAGHLFRGNSTP